MGAKITTIKVYSETKERLNKIKVYHRETYDETLQKIFEILNITRADPERARAKLLSIDKQHKRNFYPLQKTQKIKSTQIKNIPLKNIALRNIQKPIQQKQINKTKSEKDN